MSYGKKVWIFPDAELPPLGVNVIPGHESVIITNVTNEVAKIKFTLLYEDKEPKTFTTEVGAMRVRCMRSNRVEDFCDCTAVEGEQYAIMLLILPLYQPFNINYLLYSNLAFRHKIL